MSNPKNPKTEKAELVLRGLTREQAQCLANWFSAQGEQHASEWFDIHEVPAPTTDVRRKGGALEETPIAVVLYCK